MANWFEIGIDTDKLRRDSEEARSMLYSLGDEAGEKLREKIRIGEKGISDFTDKILAQKAKIADISQDIRNLSEKYRNAANFSPLKAELKSEIDAAKKALQEEKNALFGLTQEKTKAAGVLRNLKNEYSDYKDRLKETTTATGNMGTMFAKTFGAIGGMYAVKRLAGDIINVRGEFQQLEIAFTTLLQSKPKADALMAQMVDTAAKTPFSLQGVADGARSLLAYGFEAEKVNDTLIRLGNVAAGLGLPLERLTYLYGTTAVQGRLYARDMLQFTSSGIPVLQELAKMYGKTTGEINEMVSAGKIGFEDIKKVFEGMTNKGGKFYNLMEEQSKSLTGQISNLKDQISVKFNEMGKSSEGFTYSAISGASYMVEHYKEVGAVVAGLITVFGSYKVALAIATRFGVIDAATKEIQTLVTWKAVKAQLAHNAAVISNPYVLAAVAIGVLVTGLILYANRASMAELAAKSFNDRLKEQAEETENAKSEAEKYINTIKDEVSTQEQKLAALNNLKQLYPSIFQNMDIETIKNLKNADVIREIIRLLEIKNNLQNYGDAQKEISLLNKYQKRGGLGINNEDEEYIRKMMGKNMFTYQFVTEDEKAEFLKKRTDAYYSNEAQKTQLSEQQRIKSLSPEQQKKHYNTVGANLQKQYDDLLKKDEEFRKNSVLGGKELKFSPYQNDLKNIKQQLLDNKNTVEGLGKSSEKTYKTLKQLNSEISTEQKKLNELRKKAIAGNASTSQVEEQEKVVKELKDARQTMTGEKSGKGGTGKSATDLANKQQQRKQKAIELETKYQSDLEKLRLDGEEAEIKSRKDGFDKKIALIEFEKKKEIQAIEDKKNAMLKANYDYEKAKWESEVERDKKGKPKKAFAYKSTLTDEQSKYLGYEKQNIDTTEAYAKQQLLDDLLGKYKDFEQQRADLVKKYADDRAALETQGTEAAKKALVELGKQEQNALMEFDLMVSGKQTVLQQLFGDLSDYSLDQLKELQKKAKEVLIFINGGKYNSIQGQLFGISETRFNELQKPTEKKAVNDGFTKLLDTTKKFNTPIQNLKEGFKELFSAENKNKPEKQAQALQKITDGYNKYAAAVGLLSDVLGNLGELSGNETLKGIADGLNQVLSVGNDVMSGAQAGATFGPVGAAVGAAAGMIKGVTGILVKNKQHRDELKKQIKENQDKEYFGQLDIEAVWRSKYEWAKKIGEATLSHIKREGEELKKQSKENEEAQKKLWEKLSGQQYKVSERFEKTGLFGWGKGKNVEEWRSLSYMMMSDQEKMLYESVRIRKSFGLKLSGEMQAAFEKANSPFEFTEENWTKLQELASTGKLSEEGMKVYEAFKKAKEEGKDLVKMQEEYLESKKEIFTGTSYDNLVSGIVNAFKQGKRSAKDFADSFEDLMKGAIESSLKLLADEQMRKWYEQYYEVAKDGLTQDEISQLKQDYLTLMENLNKQAADLETITGIKIGDGQKQGAASYGAYQAITQDKADLIDGRLTGIQMSGIDRNEILKRIEMKIGDFKFPDFAEMKNIALDSWGELVAINKNTKLLYDTNELLRNIQKGTDKI